MDKTSSCSGARSARRISVACQTDADSSLSPTGNGVGGAAVSIPVPLPSTTCAKGSGLKTAAASEPTTSTHSHSNSNSDDGLLRVTIQNFSKMSDTLCSPTKRIEGVPWRIMVMPKQHVVMKKTQKCMGFFLQCCPDNTYNDAWSCQSVAEMRLIAQKSGVQNFVRKTTHVYTSKENDWGYSCFMTWADVLDENQGYIKDDKVVLEIQVKADPPKNMMSRDEFIQAIDQWYRLAEMQMQRGQIDLAIEANGQAVAYCKDKDKESMAKLKAQKDVIVKQKLVQSIKRLESGGTATVSKEEEREKLSVRAAINGTPKTTTSTVKRVVDKPHNGIKKATKVPAKVLPKANYGIKKASAEIQEKKKQQLVVSESARAAYCELLPEEKELARAILFDVPGIDDLGELEVEVPEISIRRRRILRTRRAIHTISPPSHLLTNDPMLSPAWQHQMALFEESLKKEEKAVVPPVKPIAIRSGEQVLTDEESEDLNTEEYEDDLNVSVDSNETFKMLTDRWPQSEKDATQDDNGSQSSLDMANDDRADKPVETNDSGCQTDTSLISTSTAPMRVRNTASCASSIQTPSPIAVAVGTTTTRVGIQVKPSPSPVAASSMPPPPPVSSCSSSLSPPTTPAQFEISVEDKHADSLKQVVAFFEEVGIDKEKKSMEVIRQLQMAHVAGKDEGAQECVAVVIAAHIASLNCSKVMKAMDEFLRLSEGLFTTQRMGNTLTLLRRGAAEAQQERSRQNQQLQQQQGKTPGKAVVGLEGSGCATVANEEEVLTDSEGDDDEYNSNEEEEGESEGDEEDEEEEEDEEMSITNSEEMEEYLQRHCKNEATETIRSLAARELYQFNQGMARSIERVTALQDGVKVLKQGLTKIDEKHARLNIEYGSYAEMGAKLRDCEASLTNETTAHKATKEALTAAQVQIADLKTRKEQMEKVLREKTNEVKRYEKKSSKDDNRIAELFGEKTELEDKVKVMKREMDSMKKKHAEEGKKVKREREREAETLKKMETEALHREQEREREHNLYESKARQMQSDLDTKNRELRGIEQREKKMQQQHAQQINTLNEKMRSIEATVVEMQLAGAIGLWERAKSDSLREVAELNDFMKRCHISSADSEFVEKVERSLTEWKSFADKSTKTVEAIRSEYGPQIEAIKKGELTASQVQIKISSPSALPSTLRPTPPPHSPAPGVIGQSRNGGQHIQQNGYLPTSSTPSHHHHHHSPSGSASAHSSFSRAPSPPQMDKPRMAPIGTIGSRPMATVAPQTMDCLEQDLSLSSCGLMGGVSGMGTIGSTIGNNSDTNWSTWQSPLGLGMNVSSCLSTNSDVHSAVRPLYTEPQQWENRNSGVAPSHHQSSYLPTSSSNTHSHSHSSPSTSHGGPSGPPLPGYPQWATNGMRQQQMPLPPPGWQSHSHHPQQPNHPTPPGHPQQHTPVFNMPKW